MNFRAHSVFKGEGFRDKFSGKIIVCHPYLIHTFVVSDDDYFIETSTYFKIPHLVEWCRENIPDDDWSNDFTRFYFRHERDLMLFKLAMPL